MQRFVGATPFTVLSVSSNDFAFTIDVSFALSSWFKVVVRGVKDQSQWTTPHCVFLGRI